MSRSPAAFVALHSVLSTLGDSLALLVEGAVIGRGRVGVVVWRGGGYVGVCDLLRGLVLGDDVVGS